MSSNQLGVTSSITKDDRSASPISVTAGLLARLKICDVPDAMDLILLVIKADDLEATRAEEGKGKLVHKRKQGTSSQPFCLAMVWPRFPPQTPRNAQERATVWINTCLPQMLEKTIQQRISGTVSSLLSRSSEAGSTGRLRTRRRSICSSLSPTLSPSTCSGVSAHDSVGIMQHPPISIPGTLSTPWCQSVVACT